MDAILRQQPDAVSGRDSESYCPMLLPLAFASQRNKYHYLSSMVTLRRISVIDFIHVSQLRGQVRYQISFYVPTTGSTEAVGPDPFAHHAFAPQVAVREIQSVMLALGRCLVYLQGSEIKLRKAFQESGSPW